MTIEHHTPVTVCCLFDLGLDEAECADLLRQWNALCADPLLSCEIRPIVQGVYEVRQEGDAGPDADRRIAVVLIAMCGFDMGSL